MYRSNVVRICATAAIITFSGARNGFGQSTFYGAIDPELTTSESVGTLITCNRLASDAGLATPVLGHVFGCFGSWFTTSGELRVPLRLVEPHDGGSPLVFVDADRNGVFTDDERFMFSRRRHRYARAETRFTIPTPSGSAFSRFPVILRIPKANLNPPLPAKTVDQRHLFQSMFLFATARVPIDGKTLFFRYSVFADAMEMDLRGNIQAIDEGALDESRLSSHRAADRPNPPVFRIGTRYVSTERVDLRARIALIRFREPSDYRRLELRRGLTVPDFAFLDVSGKIRRLSEFQNRHVLLYFWYRGCTPCEDELSQVRSAGARFASDKLAIVGLMDDNTPAETLRPLLRPGGPFDAHAAPSSSRTLIQQWFGILATPTLILLDPERRIVSLNQEYDGRHPLRGPDLLKTLRSVIE